MPPKTRSSTASGSGGGKRGGGGSKNKRTPSTAGRSKQTKKRSKSTTTKQTKKRSTSTTSRKAPKKREPSETDLGSSSDEEMSVDAAASVQVDDPKATMADHVAVQEQTSTDATTLVTTVPMETTEPATAAAERTVAAAEPPAAAQVSPSKSTAAAATTSTEAAATVRPYLDRVHVQLVEDASELFTNDIPTTIVELDELSRSEMYDRSTFERCAREDQLNERSWRLSGASAASTSTSASHRRPRSPSPAANSEPGLQSTPPTKRQAIEYDGRPLSIDATTPQQAADGNRDTVEQQPTARDILEFTNVHRLVYTQLKEIESLIYQFAERAIQLKMWVTAQIPPVADGQSMGVAVQQMALDLIEDALTFAEDTLDSMERYIDDRQEHIEMVDEHPDNIVSQRLVVSLDESQFHAHRDTLAQLLQHYFVLMKVIGDNRSRIERPRGIESQYLSQFQ